MKIESARYSPNGAIEIYETELGGICSWDVATCKLGEKMRSPAPAGHEGIGRIIKIGRGVTGFKEGDRVTGGGFRTAENFPTGMSYHIPSSNLPDELWLVEPVACVVTGLDRCQLKPGDRVVVIGCGFMGLLLIQGLAKSFAHQVVAIDIDQNRLDLAKLCGAGELYNSKTEDMVALVKDLKARNIDVVVDTSGAQEGLNLATEIARQGGLINLFGWMKGDSATFDPTNWHMGGFTIVNSSPSGRLRDTFPIAIRLIHSGFFDLRPLVTHVVPLDEYPNLMKTILAGDKSYVKGVVKLNGNSK